VRWLLRLIVSFMLVVPVAAKAHPAATKIKSCAVPPGIAATRPGAKGSPIHVLVGLYVLDIKHIKDVEHSFSADFILTVRWKDSRLIDKSRGLSLAGCLVGLDDVWDPQALLLNRGTISVAREPLVQIDSKGTVSFSYRVSGDFTSRFDLREFPVDSHTLPITIISTRYGPDEVEFVVAKNITGRADLLSIAGWSIGPWATRVGYFYFAPQNRLLSQFEYEVTATRHAGFYVRKVIFPLILVIIMSWAVFWLDPVHLATQVGLSATVMVILVIFELNLGTLLPRVSYSTRVDTFLLGSRLLVFLALVEAVTTGILAAGGKEALARRLDRWARWVFPASLVVVLVLAFWL